MVTVQTCVGFLLTMVSIHLVPPIDAVIGWRWTFVFLARGTFLGAWAMYALRRDARVGKARSWPSLRHTECRFGSSSTELGEASLLFMSGTPQHRRSIQWICSCGVMPGSKPPEAIGGARNKQGARFVHYCETPICFTTGCHNSCSLRMNSVVSAGDIGRAKVARSASFCLSSG